MPKSRLTKLHYKISEYSSYSPPFYPERILIDDPKDRHSRWTSDSHESPQYLLLEFRQPSIVLQIRFGKHERSHVCNLRRFCVYGGMTKNNLYLLLEGGLRNDTNAEIFNLSHARDGLGAFPCRYMKIEPLQSWGNTFNYAIWSVQVMGYTDHDKVQTRIDSLEQFRSTESFRLCLKHLRQHSSKEVFDAVQHFFPVTLEHPCLTELHDALVEKGDFDKVESCIDKAASEHHFDHNLKNQDYKAKWNLLNPVTIDEHESCHIPSKPNPQNFLRPGVRGGHQLVLDHQQPDGGSLFLFGGWNGSRDLADLWRYDIKADSWTCLSQDTSIQGGPGARSCHKMCLDYVRKEIYVLGRYVDAGMRKSNPQLIKCDFYMYNYLNDVWTLICDNTKDLGGPALIFDHHMTMDVSRQIIYVFGGKIISSSSLTSSSNMHNLQSLPLQLHDLLPEFRHTAGDSGSVRSSLLASHDNGISTTTWSTSSLYQRASSGPSSSWSGLYSYQVSTNTWTLLRPDCEELKGRMGHSMLFHIHTRQLFIFGGQRDKEHMDDFLCYDIQRDQVIKMTDSDRPEAYPAAGFTQRATLDPELNEIYVFSGLSRDRDKREDLRNSLWMFSINKHKWKCVYRNDSVCSNDNSINWYHLMHIEPLPRYAHQLVYDPVMKVHYLFGGNPGHRACNLKIERLNDLWSMQLICATSSHHIVNRCNYVVRRQRFRELLTSAVNAEKDYERSLYVTGATVSNKVLTDDNSSQFYKEQQNIFLHEGRAKALLYLQWFLQPLVNIQNTKERDELHILVSWIFSDHGDYSMSLDDQCHPWDDCQLWREATDITTQRTLLFDLLVTYFPLNYTQPRDNLIDLLPMVTPPVYNNTAGCSNAACSSTDFYASLQSDDDTMCDN